MIVPLPTGCTFHRDVMVLIQVHHLGLDHGSILYGLGDVGRKLAFVDLATVWTALDLDLVFSHFDAHRRKIRHLPLLVATGLNVFQRGLTLLANSHWMHLHVVRLCDRPQRLSGMSPLTARFLATGRAQAAGASGLTQPITRPRLAAVPTVLGHLVFQSLNPGLQGADHSCQSVD
jgi:hypothetical protein